MIVHQTSGKFVRMSELNPSTEHELATNDYATSSTNSDQVVDEVKPAKITLWGEIMKGWEWVVFAWRMLGRLGGFMAIVQSLFLVVTVLIKRLLVQWGVIKNS